MYFGKVIRYLMTDPDSSGRRSCATEKNFGPGGRYFSSSCRSFFFGKEDSYLLIFLKLLAGLMIFRANRLVVWSPQIVFWNQSWFEIHKVSFCILSVWNVFDTSSPANWHVFWKIVVGKWHFLLDLGWSLFREHVNFRGGNKVDFESYM